jgi:hypothetical protein
MVSPGTMRHLRAGREADAYFWASVVHFFMYEVLAAPASGLPFLSMAFCSHAAVAESPPASHFFMNEVLAAPASGLPFLPTALLSQLPDAEAEVEPEAAGAEDDEEDEDPALSEAAGAEDLDDDEDVPLSEAAGAEEEVDAPLSEALGLPVWGLAVWAKALLATRAKEMAARTGFSMTVSPEVKGGYLKLGTDLHYAPLTII